MSIKPQLRRLRRRCAELLGSARYSRPALNELDRKLERHLDFDGGTFIEAGANDGFTQSNTYYFERMRGWSGLLIEPMPELAAKCRRERRRSVVVQSALVRRDFAGTEIEMQFAGLMSVSAEAFGSAERRREHVAVGLRQAGVDGTYSLRVPARTLSAIIDEHGGGRTFDLLSLDVEGAEETALAGLDLARHAPRFICVEARDPAAIARMLAAGYDLAEVLSDSGSHQDLLFRRREP